MKFIDLTQDNPSEQELTLPQIQHLLKQETGRYLVIGNRDLYTKNETLFKLVRWPDPVGFGVVAAKDIPKGTPLFFYGGELRDHIDGSEVNGVNFYIQQVNERRQYRDGKESGDFGCLLAHAPDEKLLERIGFSAESQQAIQTENTVYLTTNNDDLLFLACENISSGTIITHNYGEDFWRLSEKSFLLFQKNSMSLVDLSRAKFDGNAYIVPHPSDGRNFISTNRGAGGIISTYTRPLLFTSQFLLQANAVENNRGVEIIWRQWLMIAAHALKCGMQLALEINPAEPNRIEVFIKDDAVGLELALSPSDCMPTLNTITVRRPSETKAYAVDLNSLFGFFKARQVTRYTRGPNIHDCEPPLGSQIYKHKTILPNPVKPNFSV